MNYLIIAVVVLAVFVFIVARVRKSRAKARNVVPPPVTKPAARPVSDAPRSSVPPVVLDDDDDDDKYWRRYYRD